MKFKDKIINALYALAVGDAVGNHFEFKSDINQYGVIEYANNANTLVISDDTQMTLFGISAIYNSNSNELSRLEKSFIKEYLNWYKTQTEYQINNSGLLQFSSLFSRQAPGNTCLSALKSIANNKEVVNDSYGCGSVMRLLPVVMLYNYRDLDEVIEIAKMTANITHKHTYNDVAVLKYMDATKSVLRGEPIKNVIQCDHMSDIGEGWTAVECVDMAIWAFTNATTFDELLMLSIAHDGDSDSVAAIAGSLWGLSGREVPQKYINKLTAQDALDFCVTMIKTY